MRRTKRGGWPYSQPPNVPFDINRASPQADGLVLWMPWGGGTPGAHRHIDRVSGLVFTEAGTPVWVADSERGWSMLFDVAQSECLTCGSVPVTGAPFTLTAWAKTDDDASAQQQTAVAIGDISTWNNHFLLTMNPNGNRINFRVRDPVAGAVDCFATTSFIQDTWHHLAAVAYAVNSRAVFLDSGGKGTNAGAVTPAGLDTTRISSNVLPVISWELSGNIAVVRIYDRALTDAEVYALYAPETRWELYRPLVRRWLGWRSPAPPPVGGHMTLWGRYWGP